MQKQQQKSKAQSPFQNITYIKLKHRAFPAHAFRGEMTPLKQDSMSHYEKSDLPQRSFVTDVWQPAHTKMPGIKHTSLMLRQTT